MNNVKIYLGGGFRGANWQRDTINKVGDETKQCSITYFNPRDKERGTFCSEHQAKAFTNPTAYTYWDIAAINKSNIVFAYIAKDNPAVGVIAEVGYAAGKGKHTVLVIEEGHELFEDRYFDFLRNLPGVVSFPTLDEGQAYLKSFLELV